MVYVTSVIVAVDVPTPKVDINCLNGEDEGEFELPCSEAMPGHILFGMPE